MEHIIEYLQKGQLTVQDILVRYAPEEPAAALWHAFALACAARVLDKEQEAGRAPPAALRAALRAKHEWLANGGALVQRDNHHGLRQHQVAASKAADRFGETVLAFLRRNWKRIDGLETLRQINATSRLLAMGPRALSVAGNMAAATVVLALSANASEVAGQTAASAIHYAIFFEQLQQSPFAAGQGQTGLFLGPPPSASDTAVSGEDTDRMLRHIVSHEDIWQSERLLELLCAQQQAIHALLPLLHRRQQALDALTDRWQDQFEDALF